MSVFEVVGGNDRRSMIKRYERKSKQQAISELVDLIHCTWRQIEGLEAKLADAQRLDAVAVMYADGSVLTKAECGDAFDTCCRAQTPLYTGPQQPAGLDNQQREAGQ